MILTVKNLSGKIENKIIINKLNLSIKQNEIHFLMGPNGCGKSTFSKILTGHPSYDVLKGEITFQDKNLLKLKPEIRAKEGLFLAFQYPIEISGINNLEFLKFAYDEKRKYFNKKAQDSFSFLTKIKKYLKKLNIKEEFLYRDLNVGFSGGEKKLNELLQILLLEPKLVILDEIDSGLDIDAIKRFSVIINKAKRKNSFLIITHNPQILQYINPNFIHIMTNGSITHTGGRELVDLIEKSGYDIFKKF